MSSCDEQRTIITLPLSEAFHLTPALRWRVPSGTTTKPPVLEQMWQGDRGTQRWEPVPRVVED